jgi:A/G-specific adenine glycosylase
MTKTSTSDASNPAAFRKKLQNWYRADGRHELPWRLTRDPYAVLVSEVMLQQTQVERVLPYYEAWIQRWPTFAALAGVPASEVIREWRGLGYNRRALNLHRLAVEVTQNYGGVLPHDSKTLLGLPGVGAYTASAIRCFAREECVVVVDTNIALVLARTSLGLASQKEAPPSAFAAAAARLLPPRRARDHNLALMDLGATICQSRAPQCERCPIENACLWRTTGQPAAAAANSARTPKFETTARFARGRIVDALRDQPASESELAALLPQPHRDAIREYLSGLEREGMVVKSSDSAWALPES